MSTLTLEKPATGAVALQTQFKSAKAIYEHILEAENSLLAKSSEILILAFRLGLNLTEMKEEIGHGKWLFWLGGSWPQLGERNAQRCMALVRDNPEVVKKMAKGKSVESADFTDESKRKFMWHYVPAKERLALAGDEEVTFAPSYLTFINNYFKWDRQVKIGHQELPPLETFRRDFEPLVISLRDRGGLEWLLSLLSRG